MSTPAPMPQLPGARHREVTVETAVLHLAELGAPDAPPILLVHGWPQNWWCWNRVAPLLADDHRLLIPDLRGHGWSSAPGSGYEKERLANDLLGLLDALGIDRVAYIGHDWGAFVGLLIGIHAPERISQLIALSIPHPWPSVRDRLNPLRAMTLAYQLPLSTPVLGAQLMRRGLTRRVLAGANAGFSDRDIEVYEATMGSEAGARTTTEMYRSFLLKELPAIALGRYRHARLDVPTRLIVGERDPITRVSALDGYEGHAPRMTVERVPEAGHFLPQERPDLVARRLIEGVRGRDGGLGSKPVSSFTS
jgi:pimeloyl-ACP methyl ester carboxylesterase